MPRLRPGDAVEYGEVVGLHLSQIDEADDLLTNDPLALLIGMVLDQQVSEGWSGMVRPAGTLPHGRVESASVSGGVRPPAPMGFHAGEFSSTPCAVRCDCDRAFVACH
ncbi:hypothetical protein BCD49_21670 [Pseudofrankia sp. EUN1h]|nr:hypothetical protein BCD49_21670 [Pseudofrankia sp. EUN1h]